MQKTNKQPNSGNGNTLLAAFGLMFCLIGMPAYGSGPGHDHVKEEANAFYDPAANTLTIPAINVLGQFYSAELVVKSFEPVIWELTKLNQLPESNDDASRIASYNSDTGIATIPHVKILNGSSKGYVDFELKLLPGSSPVQLSEEKISVKNLIVPNCRILTADRLFDGVELHINKAVLISGNEVESVDSLDKLESLCSRITNLGDATIMPGFIESHAHITFQNVPRETVLRHGVTTVRDVGGPLLPPAGGKGELRLLSSGPIIQAPYGYPDNLFGSHDDESEGSHHATDIIAFPAATPEEGRHLVQHFEESGAAIIKIALEPGGEHGAPWMAGGHGHGSGPETPWPILDLKTVEAIVDEAHSHGLLVTAHIGESTGAVFALDAGVDEWSHVPCAALPDELLQRAVNQGVKIVTTIDTLSNCEGIEQNTHRLAHFGAEFLYGSEIGHNDVPWGINAEELHRMLHSAGMTPLQIFQAATSKAGENSGIDKLGTLTPKAPADIIAVRGNPFEKFKLLEYPDLVISGGYSVVDNFAE